MADQSTEMIVNHYNVLSRDLSAVKAILTKALATLDHPEVERSVEYWRRRLNYAVNRVDLADNEADCMREVALEALPSWPENVIPFPGARQ